MHAIMLYIQKMIALQHKYQGKPIPRITNPLSNTRNVLTNKGVAIMTRDVISHLQFNPDQG